jgi:hypothetical protein
VLTSAVAQQLFSAVTWTGKGGLAVRLQLRGTQPAPAASAHRATTIGKAPGAVRLKTAKGLCDDLPEYQQSPVNTRQNTISNRFQRREITNHPRIQGLAGFFNEFLDLSDTLTTPIIRQLASSPCWAGAMWPLSGWSEASTADLHAGHFS